MTDRVERLTNLLALLLETREPLSLAADRVGELDGQYPDGARRRAGRRSSATRRRCATSACRSSRRSCWAAPYAGQTRYWIDRERYELRGLQLDEDEARALQVAMAATRPGSTSGQEALWKLGAGLLDRSAPVVGGAARPARRCRCCATRCRGARRWGSTTATCGARSTRGACCCATASGTSSASTTAAASGARSASTASRRDRRCSTAARSSGRRGSTPATRCPTDPKLIGAERVGCRRPGADRRRPGPSAAVAELGEHRVRGAARRRVGRGRRAVRATSRRSVRGCSGSSSTPRCCRRPTCATHVIDVARGGRDDEPRVRSRARPRSGCGDCS